VPRPCADKQRITGRTALPIPTTTVVPLVRCIRLRNTQRRNALPARAKCILTTTSEFGKLGLCLLENPTRPKGARPSEARASQPMRPLASSRLRNCTTCIGGIVLGSHLGGQPAGVSSRRRLGSGSRTGSRILFELTPVCSSPRIFLRSAPLSNRPEQAAGGTRVQPINRHRRIHHAARDPRSVWRARFSVKAIKSRRAEMQHGARTKTIP
jgi:hypothetical protein